MTRHLLLAALPLLLAVGCAQQQQSFVRRYSGEARLTPKQEKIVVQLARAAHVKEIQEIRIAYDGRCGPWIYVKGRETLKGRTVTYPLAVIGYLPWMSCRYHRPLAHVPVVDGFWVHRSHQTGATILKVRGREHRVRLGRELSMAKAEQLVATLLAALEKGAVDHGPEGAELDDFNDFRSRLAAMALDSFTPCYAFRDPEDEIRYYQSCFSSRDGAERHRLVFGVGGERIWVEAFMRFRRSGP